MFVATYTGGSANLNFLAVEYGVAKDGLLYTGANAVDAILTTVWMVATIAIPRVLWRVLPRRKVFGTPEDPGLLAGADGPADTETIGPFDIGLLLALGGAAYWASTHATDWINGWLRSPADDPDQVRNVPLVLVITTLALALAQVPAITRLAGARALGMTALYLFLAVIGALCDLTSLDRLGDLALSLWIFAATVIAVHGLVCFGLAGLFKLDWDMAAVASQANVGGGTTALALARSLGRSDLALPAILVGCLGTASGTYLGLFTAKYLL
jgi:uncharacterized membrane protein